MTHHVDTADQAKLIRKILKEAFPGQKFSVRIDRYSGGSSIDVRWTDGPTAKQVDHLIQPLSGGYFDGMQDYKGMRYHMLDGRRVRFGADFIFASRQVSDRLGEKALAALKRKNPGDPVMQALTLADFAGGAGWNIAPGVGTAFAYRDSQRRTTGFADNANEALLGQLSGMTECPTRKSETAARITFLGDDGYGYGAVGNRAHLELVQ